jgi:hypothetical protein
MYQHERQAFRNNVYSKIDSGYPRYLTLSSGWGEGSICLPRGV